MKFQVYRRMKSEEKEKSKRLVPGLRFPEFRDDGEWEYNQFSKFIVLYRGSSPRPIQNYLTKSKTGVNWIKIGDTKSSDNFIIKNVEEKITVEGAKKSRKVNIGELILANSMSFGKTYELGIEGYIYDGWFVLREYEKYFIKPFLIQLLNSEFMQSQYLKLSAGGIVQNISSTIVYQTVLARPNFPEQQKIADLLTSTDELIAAQTQKIDTLKDHKKGLMQKLFPAEEESLPELRFPEFWGEGEWEEKKIDNIKSIITDFVANGSFQSLRENLNVHEREDFAYYVRLVDLRAGLGHSEQKYVDKPTYSFLKKSSLLGGELLMANIGANVGEVWQMPFVNKPSTLAPNMIMLKFKLNIDSRFIFYFLSSEIGIKYISVAISGSGHPKVNKTDLRQVLVYLPPSLPEQQKIANCLSTLDELIQQQTNKLQALQNHKKGLMQQIFPSYE